MCVSLLMLLWTWNQWHRLRIAHVQRQFHPRWNCDRSKIQSTQRNQNKTRYVLPAIMGPSPNSRGSCIPRLPEKYLPTFEKYLPPLGVVDCSSVGKQSYLSCHLKSWFGPRSHFTTFAHHVITLKDKRIEQLNITIHHKQEGAVWCHTTNGCTAEIPATC